METKFTLFIEEYRRQLVKAVTNYPDEYAYPVSEVDFTVSRMATAIAAGTFNKNSRAFKATCKALGIKHTYSAIKAFINGLP